MTFDWIIWANRDSGFKEQIEDLITNSQTIEITYRQMYRLRFDGSSQSLLVTPFSNTSDFNRKIIPTQISYDAVKRLLKGDWDSLTHEDIKRRF